MIACLALMLIASPTAFAAPLNGGGGKPSNPTPDSYSCTPYGSYTNVSKTGDTFHGVTMAYHNYNGTAQYEDMQFSATTTGTVGVSISASATVDANAIVAGAQATTSLTLYAWMSTTLGNTTTVKNVPPYTNVYAQFGVWTERTTGHYIYHYNNCTTVDYGYITAWVPDGFGWTTWN